MMRKMVLAAFTMIVSTSVFAGDTENITACVRKAKEYAGVSLDFDVTYEGNILAMSTAKWKNAECEVKLGTVFNLIVNGETLIHEQFSGKNSYDLNKALQDKTDATIKKLNLRIGLLEKTMDKASEDLKKLKPDHDAVTRNVNEAIEKSLCTPN